MVTSSFNRRSTPFSVVWWWWRFLLCHLSGRYFYGVTLSIEKHTHLCPKKCFSCYFISIGNESHFFRLEIFDWCGGMTLNISWTNRTQIFVMDGKVNRFSNFCWSCKSWLLLRCEWVRVCVVLLTCQCSIAHYVSNVQYSISSLNITIHICICSLSKNYYCIIHKLTVWIVFFVFSETVFSSI